jgi:hypothetical protein
MELFNWGITLDGRFRNQESAQTWMDNFLDIFHPWTGGRDESEPARQGFYQRDTEGLMPRRGHQNMRFSENV